MGKKSTKIPPIDPRLYAALEKQTDIADEMAEFVRSSYADNQERMVGIDALNEQVINQQMDLSAKAGERADDAYSFYQTKGRPVVEKALSDASNFDSADEIANARSRATATAQTAADNATSQNSRMLQRLGVVPNSGRFAALNNEASMRKAAMLAGAGNNAEEGRRAGAIGMRQQASNLAQGMPATSMGFSGQSGGFGSSAAGVGASGLGSAMSTQNAAMSGMSGTAGQYGNIAGGFNSAYGNQLQATSLDMQQKESKMSGLGQLAGLGMSMMSFADGGKVQGPGTGTSDSVPAVNTDNGQRIQLSNGEFVIPADVVRTKGTDFFQKLIEQHHRPVSRNIRSA